MNPVTNKIYVANWNEGKNGSVTVIDDANNSANTIPFAGPPDAVAVNPVTNKIYVAYDGNKIMVIDGATNSTAAATVQENFFPVQNGGTSIAVNPVTNKIYMTSTNGGGVVVLDCVTNKASRIAAGGARTRRRLIRRPIKSMQFILAITSIVAIMMQANSQ